MTNIYNPSMKSTYRLGSSQNPLQELDNMRLQWNIARSYTPILGLVPQWRLIPIDLCFGVMELAPIPTDLAIHLGGLRELLQHLGAR